MEPNVHIWTSDKLSWFETTDDFPRYKQFESDGILEESEKETTEQRSNDVKTEIILYRKACLGF